MMDRPSSEPWKGNQYHIYLLYFTFCSRVFHIYNGLTFVWVDLNLIFYEVVPKKFPYSNITHTFLKVQPYDVIMELSKDGL